ncbi:hypothetical protein PsorP6_005093 [Peronosclerospora sorghi]|uniref:Uncharacterized protein n=1 Tax=Peronosclerospora sorghi TaxID=230839 RepID=A0ACC0W5W5_9STRA|nr:hypothetical protein PsorP6_018740 [Peronosclerospora sorghi]KAI9913086.1 hypothetical protein PsorP6_005093 [Peronosclerospora sorghi]
MRVMDIQMGGRLNLIVQVVEALLERGADPIAQDRSGLTALSLVRTLSRPPEEVVQILVDAESSAIWSMTLVLNVACCRMTAWMYEQKALASALFLRKLSSFTLSQHSSAFLRQTIALINTLLKGSHCQKLIFYKTQGDNVAFDQVLQERVPMFFDVMSTCHVVPLDTIFTHSLFSDSTFVDDLKLEADGYGLSLVSPTVKFATLAGPSWMSVLLKLIQCFKVEISEPNDLPEDAPIPQDGHGYNKHLLQQKLSISSSSTSCSVGSRSTVCSANPTTFIATAREAWYYAVLFKAATYSLPGEIAVTPQCDVAIASVDVSKFFPLEDRLLIGSDEYFAIDYSSQTREIQLDRQYNGNEATVVKAYATGACSSRLPPYIALKRIWEREPGNKYEDQMSSEQELFQDYQFLDPDSECEVAIKLGPIVNGNEAKEIVAEWKHAAKELFNARECKSGLACCKHYCPQRSGHFLCLETLAVIGQGLAKRHLGRPTFSKPLKPRALLQRLQDRFKGTEEWPGSRSSVNPPP